MLAAKSLLRKLYALLAVVRSNYFFYSILIEITKICKYCTCFPFFKFLDFYIILTTARVAISTDTNSAKPARG